MYEDTAIELAAFPAGGRVFCIASAGCTAMALAPRHDEVVAVDINPVQLAYAARRIAGAGPDQGAAERVLAFGRSLAPVVGWTRSRLGEFLDLEDPFEQSIYWRTHLDTLRFRAGFDGLLSLTALRTVYAAALLDFLPKRLGPALRARMTGCFSRHANRRNPYARALLLGEQVTVPPPPEAGRIRLVQADAAAFLESEPPGSFAGFSLSNILDGAAVGYRRRLVNAVRRAAAPDAVAVIRSFRDATHSMPSNHAADDRAMLWGIVDVRSAVELT
jgi:hypothetical protein